MVEVHVAADIAGLLVNQPAKYDVVTRALCFPEVDYSGQVASATNNGSPDNFLREMLDVTGEDIARLNDGDARTLVARLALAELRDQAAPQSAVTAGGHQDAPDDGIDVRVELDGALAAPDFIPRAHTGYQVKKSDMPQSDISREMRPGGVLRREIGSLADVGGAYIIVSLQGSVTNSALARRRQAMRNALAGHPNADELLTDFYDRDRLAIWVNNYPGAAAWVRAKIGSPISGWRPIGRWSNMSAAEDAGYLVSDEACIIDERAGNREKLTIADGIDRLRAALALPRQSVRLIGLSGVGKTRLVQALFERGIGREPLDPALSVYTDFSDGLVPSAQEMARRLVESGRRAILIIDNCNPATHGQLTQICSETGSEVSLLTVEYDVRDDEPERTQVFRLTNAAHAVIEEWLERDFTQVSPVDRRLIAEFSDGNFRVARLLAESLRRGETLGRLRSQDLFQRIFHQRYEPNGRLLNDAEVLALLYSFDGEDESSDGELARLAAFFCRSVSDLFGSVAELRRREIVQSRGRWRAVLPQAIANPLAARLLERTPSAKFDLFCAKLPPRMLKSLSRRLGYLHDCAEARAAVARWLEPLGPRGNLFAAGETGLSIVCSIAPTAPDIVLARITSELNGPDGSFILSTSNPLRWRWISLLKSLAYEPVMFDIAASSLARFVAAEPAGHNNNSATGPLKELFYLHLSGTHATPTQRREVVRALCSSTTAPELRRAGILALEGFLHSHHFTSIAEFDFGAQSRDFGWEPKTFQETYDWYNEAIALAVKLSERLTDAKAVLANNLRDLWQFAACHDALERASTRLIEMGGWIEGWIACRATLRFDGDGMPPDIRTRLQRIISRLEPTDLIERARAVVLTRSGAYDVADGEEDDDPIGAWERASQTAVDIGRAFASNRALTDFLPEVIIHNSGGRTFEFGRGLAQGAVDLMAMWIDIVAAFLAVPATTRNPRVLGGFLTEAHRTAPDLVDSILNAALRDTDLVRMLPYLQANAALDAEGLRRLQTAVREGLVEANAFFSLASGLIANAPEQPLIAMLNALSQLTKGIGMALEILHMRFYSANDDGVPPERLLDLGRELLKRYDFTDIEGRRDYGLRMVVKLCLSGANAVDDAKIVCANVRAALDDCRPRTHEASHLLEGLFKAQPEVALDCFLLDGPPRRKSHLLEFAFADASPVESMDAVTLCAWADKDGEKRYPLLGSALSLFAGKRFGDTTGLSPLFLAVMAKAPNRRQFLGDGSRRLHPTAWSGSLARILEKRKRLLGELLDYPDPEVRAWLHDRLRELDGWIAQKRQSENERERSFE